MEAMIVEAVRMLHLVAPADNSASERLFLARVLDDVPRVIHVVQGVLAPLMINKHRVLFAWVKSGVGVLRWCPVVSRTHEGKPNRLSTGNEEQPNDRVVQMDSGVCVAFDRQVHAVPLVDIMEQVCSQRVGLGT